MTKTVYKLYKNATKLCFSMALMLITADIVHYFCLLGQIYQCII
jgi:hypothetical protein